MSGTNVTAEFLAKLFGISVRRVQQLAQEKVIPKAEKGQYPLLPCVSGYIKSLQDALRHGGGENGDIARARARYEIARAEEKELEVAKLLGEVVLAEDVQQMWETAATNWRAKVLALPSKLAVQTATITDRHAVEDIATTLIESTLTELSIYGHEPSHQSDTEPANPAPPRPRRTRKTKAAAKADNKSVG